MGGYGSGKRQGISKKTTGFYSSLDARHLQRINLLQDDFSYALSTPDQKSSISIDVEDNELHIHLTSKHPGEANLNVNQCIEITWTPCHLGGKRAWFLCPNSACGKKRVAILYLNKIFACRDCHKLAYHSQRLNREDRAFKRADHIRKLLGWKPGIVFGQGQKPKGMHWYTFQKIMEEYNAHIETILKFS